VAGAAFALLSCQDPASLFQQPVDFGAPAQFVFKLAEGHKCYGVGS